MIKWLIVYQMTGFYYLSNTILVGDSRMTAEQVLDFEQVLSQRSGHICFIVNFLPLAD
jgi:hypothetical protein